MKISELISELVILASVHGDLEVGFHDLSVGLGDPDDLADYGFLPDGADAPCDFIPVNTVSIIEPCNGNRDLGVKYIGLWFGEP